PGEGPGERVRPARTIIKSEPNPAPQPPATHHTRRQPTPDMRGRPQPRHPTCGSLKRVHRTARCTAMASVESAEPARGCLPIRPAIAVECDGWAFQTLRLIPVAKDIRRRRRIELHRAAHRSGLEAPGRASGVQRATGLQLAEA